MQGVLWREWERWIDTLEDQETGYHWKMIDNDEIAFSLLFQKSHQEELIREICIFLYEENKERRCTRCKGRDSLKLIGNKERELISLSTEERSPLFSFFYFFNYLAKRRQQNAKIIRRVRDTLRHRQKKEHWRITVHQRSHASRFIFEMEPETWTKTRNSITDSRELFKLLYERRMNRWSKRYSSS